MYLALWIAIIISLLILTLVILGTRPFRLNSLVKSDPASSYEAALSRIKQIQSLEQEMDDLNPQCGTSLLTHGWKAANVIVFLHGFSSCPDQFARLGCEYFEEGYNVYLPRTPRHGIKDRLGGPLKGLTAEKLAEHATQSVDIAQGLGERVIVVGLSGGGSMTTWLSQVRPDVDLAVPIAPFLGIGFLPRILNRPLANIILRSPDFFMWWDPVNKVNNPNSAPYAYTRYSVHALFENLRLGFVAEAEARQVRPAAEQILTITNANDTAVNNAMVAEFESIWSKYGDRMLRSYQFPKELHLPHDLITVGRPDGNIELVYPVLHDLIR
jgi:pimeloyl-ACP methyl ester carboxylesterase